MLLFVFLAVPEGGSLNEDRWFDPWDDKSTYYLSHLRRTEGLGSGIRGLWSQIEGGKCQPRFQKIIVKLG